MTWKEALPESQILEVQVAAKQRPGGNQGYGACE